MRITLDMMQFRTAVAVALPHSAGPKAGVRGDLRVQVTEDWAWVMASSGSTSVMARAAVLEAEGLTGSPADDAFHLSPAAAKKFLAVFAATSSKDDFDQALLLVECESRESGHQMTFQDVGGLIDGNELVLQGGAPDPEFPNVAATVMPAPFSGEDLPLHTIVGAIGLGRWVRSAKEHGQELTITGNRRTGQSYQVALGGAVRGILSIARTDPEDEDTPDFDGMELDWRQQTEDLAHALNLAQREHQAAKDETEAKDALASAVRKGFKNARVEGLTVTAAGESFTLTRDDVARLDEVDS